MRTLTLSARRGLTLVETVVALTLLALCLTGLAGTGAVSLRRLGDATDRETATRLANNRLQRLIATPCGATTSGATSGSFAEQWTLNADGAGQRDANVLVHFALHGAPRTVSVDAHLPC